METLDNRQYFPSFAELPMADEYLDPMYFAETADGHVVPTKTWCFFAEVIDNSLSQLPEFFHRVEVRDINGETTSILFTPDSHSFPYHTLSNGCTVFVRYASKCYFSDLMTQVLKVDDMDFVKVIQQPLDTLLTFSTFYYGSGSACLVCGTDVSSSSSRCLCNRCDVARYCSPGCMQQHSGEHGQHCGVCQQLSAVLNVDFDRFVEAVPFR